MKLQIKNWQRCFETPKSKNFINTGRVCTPNKLGLGLAHILSLEDGAAVFGIFKLLVDACSRQAKPRLGWLTEDGRANGRPWTYEDMRHIIRRPIEEIQRCVSICTCAPVNWMDDRDTVGTLQGPREVPVSTLRGPHNETRRDETRTVETRREENANRTSADADPSPSQNRNSFPPGFVAFWSLYPTSGRNSRKKCLAIWRREKLEAKADEINGGLARWIQSQRWADGVICNATTWLGDERWNNVPPPAPRAADPDLPEVIYPTVEEAMHVGEKP